MDEYVALVVESTLVTSIRYVVRTLAGCYVDEPVGEAHWCCFLFFIVLLLADLLS